MYDDIYNTGSRDKKFDLIFDFFNSLFFRFFNMMYTQNKIKKKYETFISGFLNHLSNIQF